MKVYSPTNDTIRSFDLTLSPSWEYNDTIIPQKFLFTFVIDDIKKDLTEKDTAEFVVSTSSNFDVSIYPETIGANSLIVQDSSSNKTSFYSTFVKDQQEIRNDSFTPKMIFAKSDKWIFDDNESPYVNFYLEIDKNSGFALAVDEKEIRKGACGIYIWLNKKVDSLLIGDMPYDVISVKPEPDTYSPYKISYTTPEKVNEVLNKGLYLSTVNREIKDKKERDSFLRYVLFGAFVSFILSGLIALLRKWRNLSHFYGGKNPYD